MGDVNNVSWGKPAVIGAVSSAPLGTQLPTDAKSELPATFKNLGYISEDGLTNEDTRETNDLKAWGGDTVLTLYTGKSDTFTFTLIEATNVNVLKEVYGSTNVTGTLETGIVISSNASPLEAHCLVIDTVLKGGVLKRIVIPNGSVSEVGEITYKDDEAIGYETTIKCAPDAKGNTHYEYLTKKASA